MPLLTSLGIDNTLSKPPLDASPNPHQTRGDKNNDAVVVNNKIKQGKHEKKYTQTPTE